MIRIYRNEAYKTLGSGTGAWAREDWEARTDTARRKWLCLIGHTQGSDFSRNVLERVERAVLNCSAWAVLS